MTSFAGVSDWQSFRQPEMVYFVQTYGLLDDEINAKDSEWKNLRVWRDLNACNDEFFTKHFVYNFQVA